MMFTLFILDSLHHHFVLSGPFMMRRNFSFLQTAVLAFQMVKQTTGLYFFCLLMDNFLANQGGTTKMRFQPRLGRYLAAAAENIVSILDVETQACRYSLKVGLHNLCTSFYWM